MKKILITGSSGFIGSHLMRVLGKKYKVIGYDIKEGNNIADKNRLISQLKGCDVVIHLAALVSVKQSWENPDLFYLNNVVGTSKVVEAAKIAKVKRLIFASSCAVYYPFSSPYAATKAMGELILEVNKDLLPSIAFRFFNVYGKGQNPEYAAVIPEFIKGVRQGEIKVFGKGDHTRDFVYVGDICRAIERAIEIESKLPKFVCCDVGTGKSVSVSNLARIIIDIIGKEPKTKYLPERKEVAISESNTKTLSEIFDYVCNTDLADALRDLISTGL